MPKPKRAPLLIRKLHQPGDWISRLTWSPDGSEIGAGSQGGFVTVWNVETGKARLEITQKGLHAFTFVWHPDGSRFLTSNELGQIYVWDRASGSALARIDVPAKVRTRSKGWSRRDTHRRGVHGLVLLDPED